MIFKKNIVYIDEWGSTHQMSGGGSTHQMSGGGSTHQMSGGGSTHRKSDTRKFVYNQ